MRETDLAYLAGIIDADGYVTAAFRVRKGYSVDCGAHVGITGSDHLPHDLAAALFGGTVSSYQPTRSREHHRQQFHWQQAGRRAVPVLLAVLPYLRVKHDRACLALALQDQVEELRASRLEGDFAPWQEGGYDPTYDLAVAVQEIRECNSRRGRPSDQLGHLAAVLDGRTWDEYPEPAA